MALNAAQTRTICGALNAAQCNVKITTALNAAQIVIKHTHTINSSETIPQTYGFEPTHHAGLSQLV